MSRSGSKYRFELALGFAIILGLAVRLMLIVRSGWRVDYDEAMIGLMGLRVLRGEWMAFVPAQPTLGTLEAYLLAPLLALFGASAQSFRLLSLILSALYIASTALVARAAYGDRVGALAALLASIAPPYMMIGSLKTWGATIETIILGNFLLVVTADVIAKAHAGARYIVPLRKHGQAISLALMGFIAGVMFWNAWLGFYYFVPVALLMLWKGRPALARDWWPAIIAFLVGSLPFWAFNFSHSFASFSTVLGGSPLTDDEWSAVLSHAWADLLPRLVSGDPVWRVSGPRGLTLLLGLYYGGLLYLLVWPMARRSFPPRASSLRLMLGIFVLVVPILYLFSGYSRNALNRWELDATGRYVLMLHTALPIGAAALVTAISRWRVRGSRLLAASMILLAISLNGLGVLRLDPVMAFNSPYYDRLPTSLDPLIETLDTHNITHVWVDAGIGQVLMFQTRERIIAADYYDSIIAGGLVRFPDALEAVGAAPRTAFVVPVMAGQADPPIQRALDAAGVDYTSIQVTPTLMLYIPDRWIDPWTIAQGLGYQY